MLVLCNILSKWWLPIVHSFFVDVEIHFMFLHSCRFSPVRYNINTPFCVVANETLPTLFVNLYKKPYNLYNATEMTFNR